MRRRPRYAPPAPAGSRGAGEDLFTGGERAGHAGEISGSYLSVNRQKPSLREGAADVRRDRRECAAEFRLSPGTPPEPGEVRLLRRRVLLHLGADHGLPVLRAGLRVRRGGLLLDVAGGAGRAVPGGPVLR